MSRPKRVMTLGRALSLVGAVSLTACEPNEGETRTPESGPVAEGTGRIPAAPSGDPAVREPPVLDASAGESARGAVDASADRNAPDAAPDTSTAPEWPPMSATIQRLPIDEPVAFEIANGSLYVSRKNRVERAALDGTAATPIEGTHSVNARIATDGEFLTWEHAGNIFVVPTEGGTVRRRVSGLREVTTLTMHEGVIYITTRGNSNGGDLLRVRATGDSAPERAALTLFSGDRVPPRVLGDRIFAFDDGEPVRIGQTPRAALRFASLAEWNRSYGLATFRGFGGVSAEPGNLAADDTHVYFVEGPSFAGDPSQLRRVEQNARVMGSEVVVEGERCPRMERWVAAADGEVVLFCSADPKIAEVVRFSPSGTRVIGRFPRYPSRFQRVHNVRLHGRTLYWLTGASPDTREQVLLRTSIDDLAP
jgi:hypothetical protein